MQNRPVLFYVIAAAALGSASIFAANTWQLRGLDAFNQFNLQTFGLAVNMGLPIWAIYGMFAQSKGWRLLLLIIFGFHLVDPLLFSDARPGGWAELTAEKPLRYLQGEKHILLLFLCAVGLIALFLPSVRNYSPDTQY